MNTMDKKSSSLEYDLPFEDLSRKEKSTKPSMKSSKDKSDVEIKRLMFRGPLLRIITHHLGGNTSESRLGKLYLSR